MKCEIENDNDGTETWAPAGKVLGGDKKNSQHLD